MPFPVQGSISQPFGCTSLAIEPPGSLFGQSCAHYHTGIDIAVPIGTTVGAAGPGTVSFAGWDATGFGWAVRVDHGNGIVSLYAHLSEIDVQVGQHVQTGTTIGLSGQSGNATGPHVHYEIDVNGVPVDPNTIDPGGVNVPGLSTNVPIEAVLTALGLFILFVIAE